jgi:hypothetical protein
MPAIYMSFLTIASAIWLGTPQTVCAKPAVGVPSLTGELMEIPSNVVTGALERARLEALQSLKSHY